MFKPQTVHLSLEGKTLVLHLFSTGAVAVKQRYRDARFRCLAGLADFMLDRRFTEWLPIWVLVIEHPGGTFIVDVGEISDVTKPGYFRSSGLIAQWYDTGQFRFEVSREDEADRQLARLGLGSVDTVVLSHLHFDHTDGLRHFPGVPALVHRLEWDKPFGTLPKLWPPDFRPKLVDLDQPLGPFPKARSLTSDESLWWIHTPGHTYGHTSLLVKTEQAWILFAADISYSEEQMTSGRHCAANASRKMTEDTYAKVLELAREHPLVYLPSHDPFSGERLRALSTISRPTA